MNFLDGLGLAHSLPGISQQALVQIVELIGFLPIAAAALWWWRLGADGRRRHRQFSFLLAWFGLSYILLTAYAEWRGRDIVFSYMWLSAEAIGWILWVTVLLEAATLTLESYKGFCAVGQKLMRGAIAAAGVALLLLWTVAPPDWVSSVPKFWRFQAYVVWGSLASIAVLFTAGAAYFRLIPSYNTKVIFGVVSLILVGNVASGVYWGAGQPLFYANVALHFFGFAAGAALYSPRGVEEPAVRPTAASGHGAVAQLEVINETLLRMLKR